APIVLAATLAPGGPSPRLPRNAVLRGDTVTVTWPVETWFDGRRSRPVTLDFGGRRITAVTLDPGARFPDRDRTDNRWPR
ncbi:MAG: M1 family peptidase, partial [Gemmatimonadales bacterium]|nr:M1 family peptidase [Gemmatimonadales bacterium]